MELGQATILGISGRGFPKAQIAALQAAMPAMKQPTLVVWGRNDSRAHCRALDAALRIAASILLRTRKFPNGRSSAANALNFFRSVWTYRPSRWRPI
jgi:hypothetical protein